LMWSQVSESWCWSQYRCIDVITGEWVLDVEASTGVLMWSQMVEFLALKPVQVYWCDHRWVSSWCWSQYRCHHVHTWVNSSALMIMPWSYLPCPRHTSPVRLSTSSPSRSLSPELSTDLTSQGWSSPAAAAAETLEPASCSSLPCV